VYGVALLVLRGLIRDADAAEAERDGALEPDASSDQPEPAPA
jgi:hypothetical protein